jgi:hypothetical protein
MQHQGEEEREREDVTYGTKCDRRTEMIPLRISEVIVVEKSDA